MTRRRALLALVLVATLVNLPLAHGAWTEHRVSRDGTEVRARVVDVRDTSAGGRVSFRFPAEVDPARRVWSAEVDAATFAEVRTGGELAVRVLADQPSAYHVEGEADGRLILLLTLFADLVLAGAVLLAWRFAGRPLGEPAADPR